MNHHRLTWLGIRIALFSGAAWLAWLYLRPKPPPNRTLNHHQTSGILGIYIDETDRFTLSLATSRFETSLLAKGRLVHDTDGFVVVDAWDSGSDKPPLEIWDVIRRKDGSMVAASAFEVLYSFAKANLPSTISPSAPLYGALILPFDFSFAQRKHALSISASTGQLRKTFGVHFHDLIRPLDGPCKPEYGNYPSLVYNTDGSSFLLSHSDRGCLHVRADGKDPSSEPLARLSSYSDTTLEDIISIDYAPLSESTPLQNSATVPPIRSLSLDTIVQRAPIVAGNSATQWPARDTEREHEENLQSFVRWHTPLNRNPVLVSLPIPPTLNSPDPHRFLEDWKKGSYTKFVTSPGQTKVELEFYSVQRLRESWPPIPGSSSLFADVSLDGLPSEGGSEVLVWFDGYDVQIVNPDTGRRARERIGTLKFDEVFWECSRHSGFVA